ncbi:MAG: serine hydrolase [Bacteroidetes bacterium]|nr:serine hydrolase [Bacteroidota bacterium]
MKRLLSLLATFALASTLIAQPWIAKHGLTAAQYQKAFDDLSKQGYYPKMVTGYSLNNQANYAALWQKTNIPASEFHHGLTAAQYQSTFDDLNKKGYRLVYVQGFTVGSTPYFNGIWQKTGGPAMIARHNLTAQQYQQVFDQNKNYKPKIISAYTVNGTPYFDGIWEQTSSPAWVARHNLTAQQYQDNFTQFMNQGYKLTCVTGYTNGGQAAYAAIWEKVSSPMWAARHGILLNFYQYEFDNYYDQGYTPQFLTGYNVGNSVQFAGIWNNPNISAADMYRIDTSINNYMKRNKVPGLCVAFCKNDKLVFSKGYGNAVKETGEPASPDHRWRIASVSKPMTSLGIMKLFASGKLKLSDKVFGPGGILSNFTVPNNNSLAKDITVSHLLHHTSGFQNAKGDPAFIHYEMTIDQIIQWELNNEIITKAPGSSPLYLNFGYILLARIIEKLDGGPSYEKFVQQQVFAPCGVTGMQIGKNDLSQRLPNEVQYYGSSAGGNPYGLHLDRMAGNGGWIASAPDLARVLVHINGNHGVADILPKAQMDSLTETTPNSNGYGCGFVVWGGGAKGHNGAMDGTNALLHDAGDGGGWTVVLNTRAEQDTFAWTLDSILGNLYKTISWPNYDLF